MPDLAAWLLEQITEDERVARQVQDGVVPHDQYDASGGADLCGLKNCPYGDLPERVLAECEAKRRLLNGFDDRDAGRATPGDHEWFKRILALPYADRPGYDESWRP